MVGVHDNCIINFRILYSLHLYNGACFLSADWTPFGQIPLPSQRTLRQNIYVYRQLDTILIIPRAHHNRSSCKLRAPSKKWNKTPCPPWDFGI